MTEENPPVTRNWNELLANQMQMASAMSNVFSQLASSSMSTGAASQDQFVAAMSKASSDFVNAITGVDTSQLMDAFGAEWSTEQVSLQSLFPFGLDGAEITAELSHSSSLLYETMQASMQINRLLGEGWIRAANDCAQSAAASGARIDTEEGFKMLHRLWVSTAEPILQEALHSPEYLEAQTDLIRKGTAYAKVRRKMMGRISTLLEVPNREEMNETYQSIQEMRREIRELKRTVKELSAASKKKQSPA